MVQLLESLKKHGVNIVIFVIGDQVIFRLDNVLQMSDEGHLIRYHIYSHIELNGCN